jgi:3-oxoacyl-[acyl-carrier-protein] synthase-3
MNGWTARIAGTGTSLPGRRLDSDEIDRTEGREEGWLRRACGVAARFVCTNETQEGLAAAASRAALDEAGLRPEDVDLVIAACSVGRQPIPATAPLIAREIGIESGRCLAFDVNLTCLSFLTAFEIATTFLDSERHEVALVVSAEIASRALPWAEAPDTAGLFGDGAAAAVLTRRTLGRPLIRASHFETHHDGYELCTIAAGGTAIDFRAEPERFAQGTMFRMDGRRLYRLTSERFPAFLDRLLAKADWDRDAVDLVIPHQASPLALTHLADRCGFPRAKIVDIVREYGNQIAASIPTALHLARTSGRIGPGAKVLALGTSAGVTFGGLALDFDV